jgi:hypothetical protein
MLQLPTVGIHVYQIPDEVPQAEVKMQPERNQWIISVLLYLL